MKKILLGTTAIAAATLYAQAAQAQITVSLGGYTEFFGAYYDDDVPNRTEREFQLETEIVVRADGKADNGLLYGAKVELQNSTGGTGPSVGTDEASVYLGGTWGRLELGDFDGAADTLAIYAPLIGIEQIDGDAYDFLTTPTGPGASPFAFGSLPTGSVVKAPDSADATKIMYLTPRFAGFQAGASYATQSGNEGQSVVAFDTVGGYKDFWEAGVNYTGSFAGFSVAAGVTGSGATGQDLGVGPTAPSLEDFIAWQAGAQVGYAGFKVGGGYYDGGDFNAVEGAGLTAGDTSAWHIGASYTAGPFAVGLTYADAEGFKGGPNVAAGLPSTYASEYTTYGGGVAYTLAPGFIVQADLMYVDEELRNVNAAGVATTADNEGYVAVLSTRLNF
jgi:outer membrane protein OmpU